MTDIAIQVENLSKRYQIGARQKRYDTLRDQIADLRLQIADWSKRLFKSGIGNPKPEVDFIWALKDVSFEVKRGEVVGIIGRNGAGKSTLLKILARITKPTSGRARIFGRVGSLLEVGTGFHGELTGRENIYLSGAILGMKKREIDRKFDEIVTFAEVEKFIDTPVKRYSSGMYVRLAFAVAAHLEPEILLVDEVLAVGDAAFQKKCLGKMGDVAKEGRTVLFVSHNMGAIGQMCQSAIVLSNGCKVFEGIADSAVQYYLNRNIGQLENTKTLPINSTKPIQILEVSIVDGSGRLRSVFDVAEQVNILIRYRVVHSLRGANLALILSRNGTELFCSFDTDSYPDKLEERLPGVYTYRVKLPQRLLKAGTYSVTLTTGLVNRHTFEIFRDALLFNIDALSEDTSFRGYSERRPGMIIPPVSWDDVVN